MYHWEEMPGQTKDMLRLHLLAGLGRFCVPPDKLKEVTRVRKVWPSVLRLLPLGSAPDNWKKIDG